MRLKKRERQTESEWFFSAGKYSMQAFLPRVLCCFFQFLSASITEIALLERSLSFFLLTPDASKSLWMKLFGLKSSIPKNVMVIRFVSRHIVTRAHIYTFWQSFHDCDLWKWCQIFDSTELRTFHGSQEVIGRVREKNSTNGINKREEATKFPTSHIILSISINLFMSSLSRNLFLNLLNNKYNVEAHWMLSLLDLQ